MKQKILVFGNPLVEKDCLCLKLIPKLKQKFSNIEFIDIDPSENIEQHGKNLIILDAVENLISVKMFEIKTMEDFDKIETNKIYSMHDFDLGYNLKLLKKMNLVDAVKIICVPMDIDEENALNQIQLILRKCVAQDMHGS